MLSLSRFYVKRKSQWRTLFPGFLPSGGRRESWGRSWVSAELVPRVLTYSWGTRILGTRLSQWPFHLHFHHSATLQSMNSRDQDRRNCNKEMKDFGMRIHITHKVGGPRVCFPETIWTFLNVRKAVFWHSGWLFALLQMPSLQNLNSFDPPFKAIFLCLPQPPTPNPTSPAYLIKNERSLM